MNHLQACNTKEGGQPPPLGVYQNQYGCDNKKHFAVAIAALRNDRGELKRAVIDRIEAYDPLTKEAETMKLRVVMTIQHRYQNILLEGDSVNVVDVIKSFPIMKE